MPGPATLPPLREYADGHQKIVEHIASDFDKPDDDFYPVMIIWPGDGSGHMVLGLPTELFTNERTKDVLADEIMIPVIDAFGARMLSWTISAWNLNLHGATEAEARKKVQEALRIGVSNHPNREEIVVVHALDALDYEMRVATINRTDSAPPTLGEWNDWRRPHDSQGAMEGRFVEPIQAALRDSSGRRDGKKIRKLAARGIRLRSL